MDQQRPIGRSYEPETTDEKKKNAKREQHVNAIMHTIF